MRRPTKPRPDPDRVQLGARIDAALYRKLRHRAIEEGVRVQVIVERAIARELKWKGGAR